MRPPRLRYGTLLLAASALCAQGLVGRFASSGPGSIQGTVKDQSGAVKPGASVALTDKAGNKQFEKADRDGVFTFKDLNLDQYVVETPPGTKPEIDPSATKFRYMKADRYVFFDGAGIVPVVAGGKEGPTHTDPGRGLAPSIRQLANVPDDTLTASTQADVKKWLDNKASNHLAATAVVGTSDGKSVVHFTKADANTIPTYVVVLIAANTLSDSMQKVIDISGNAAFLGIHRIDDGHWLLIFRHER